MNDHLDLKNDVFELDTVLKCINLEKIRNKIINITLITLSVISCVILPSSLFRTIEIGWQPIMNLHIVLCILLITVTLLQRYFPTKFRFLTIAGIFYISGTGGLVSFGLSSIGTSLMVIFIIFSALIYKKKGGLIAIAISSVTIFCIGLLINTKHITLNPDFNSLNTSVLFWTARSFSIGAITMFIVLIMDKFYNYLATLRNILMKQSSVLVHANELLSKETSIRIKAEYELKASEKKYTELSCLSMEEKILLEKQIQEIREQERETIAMELHDGLGQHLTGLKFLQANLLKKMEDGSSPFLMPAREIKKNIDSAIQITSNFSNTNVFFHINEKAFLSNMKNMIDTTSGIFNVNCSFSYNTDIKDKTTSINLYYITKEIITNAIKHGNCSDIKVLLEKTSQGIKVSIQYNGAYTSKKTETGTGLGLKIIKYRLEKINGEMDILEDGSGGTVITITTDKV